MTADIALKYGRLWLQTLELQVPEGVDVSKVEVAANGRSVSSAVRREGGRVVIRLDEPVTLSVGQSLRATFSVKRGERAVLGRGEQERRRFPNEVF